MFDWGVILNVNWWRVIWWIGWDFRVLMFWLGIIVRFDWWFIFVVGRYKWRCSSFQSWIAACFECHDRESWEIGDIGSSFIVHLVLLIVLCLWLLINFGKWEKRGFCFYLILTCNALFWFAKKFIYSKQNLYLACN